MWSGASAQTADLGPALRPARRTGPTLKASGPGGDMVFNVVKPTSTAYLLKKGKATGTAIVALVAFVVLSINDEGESVARWLQELRHCRFVLKYRLMEQRLGGAMPSMPDSAAEKFAVADGIQAMKVLRQNAAKWGHQRTVWASSISAGATRSQRRCSSAMIRPCARTSRGHHLWSALWWPCSVPANLPPYSSPGAG
ncbi:MAG: hypothetical protein U1F35_08015 [Steroidobacteraceae bacterium]